MHGTIMYMDGTNVWSLAKQGCKHRKGHYGTAAHLS